ncbi:hypothetical protein GGF32_004935 [Allomyces javanicus]|nr:hypothetical protein GGF32_004935 [Allomyces javanicus]
MLPEAPVLRALRLAAGYRIANPSLFLSSLPWLEVLVLKEAAASAAAFGRIQDQIEALDAPFAALVTVKTSALFILVMERVMLPRLVTAEINFACPYPMWAPRALALPKLPSVAVLRFKPAISKDEPNAVIPWIGAADPDSWAARMPRLEQLDCRASFVQLPGLNHSALRELAMYITAWDFFVAQPLNLPNVTYLSFSGEALTDLRPILPGGTLARLTRLSLRLDKMTWAAATDLTRARGLVDIRCRKLLSTGPLNRQYLNNSLWVTLTAIPVSDVPNVIQIDVTEHAGAHGVVMDRLSAVAQWLGSWASPLHRVRVAVQFKDPVHAVYWVDNAVYWVDTLDHLKDPAARS